MAFHHQRNHKREPLNKCVEEGINLGEIEEKALEMDYLCIALVKSKIANLSPKMTTYLWKEHMEDDLPQKSVQHKQY